MITPIILCGGMGKRLWPASRQNAPKPLLPLVDGRSTFSMTVERVSEPGLFREPIVVAGTGHRHLIEAALRADGRTARLLLEPAGRDTAPAIAAAAELVADEDVIMVLAADHLIRDLDGFRRTAAIAEQAAEIGRIVVFGVRPEAPVTGYGYIQPGEALDGVAAREVSRFTEKPDARTAADFVDQGYLWNSGIFVMRAGMVRDELNAHAPDILAGARAALPEKSGSVMELDRDAFDTCPKISIDFAVMEKTERAAVVDAGFDWSDLGTWSTIWAASGADESANVQAGDVTLVASTGSYVTSDRLKVGVVGMQDVVVVATDDSVLVTSMDQADRVKDLATAIEQEPEKNLGDFVRHYRPWGNYQSLDLGATHQVKRLVVEPGKRLSLQKHRHRAEHWTVVEGTAEVTVDDSVTELRPNQSIHIPQGAAHRLANHGSEPLTVIEVQCGDYLGEDDIIRLEDDFGR